MLRAPVYKFDTITVGDTVAIWRDASGWLSPARVTKGTPYYYEVVHDGIIKASGINPTRRVKAVGDTHDAELDTGASTLLPAHGEDSDNDLSQSDETPSYGHTSGAVITPFVDHDDGNVQQRSLSQHIRRTEIQHVIDDASPLVQRPLGTTRSQTAGQQAAPNSEYAEDDS